MDKAARMKLRAEQDATDALADAVRERIGETEWQALMQFNTYCAGRLGLVLEFYTREAGEPSYRLRPRTDAERQEWAEGQVEDQL